MARIGLAGADVDRQAQLSSARDASSATCVAVDRDLTEVHDG